MPIAKSKGLFSSVNACDYCDYIRLVLPLLRQPIYLIRVVLVVVIVVVVGDDNNTITNTLYLVRVVVSYARLDMRQRMLEEEQAWTGGTEN